MDKFKRGAVENKAHVNNAYAKTQEGLALSKLGAMDFKNAMNRKKNEGNMYNLSLNNTYGGKRKSRRLRRKQRGGKISPLNMNKQTNKEEERSQQAEEDASNEEATWEEEKHPCQFFEEQNSCEFAQDHDCWWDDIGEECENSHIYDSDGGHRKRKSRRRKSRRRKSRRRKSRGKKSRRKRR